MQRRNIKRRDNLSRQILKKGIRRLKEMLKKNKIFYISRLVLYNFYIILYYFYIIKKKKAMLFGNYIEIIYFQYQYYNLQLLLDKIIEITQFLIFISSQYYFCRYYK